MEIHSGAFPRNVLFVTDSELIVIYKGLTEKFLTDIEVEILVEVRNTFARHLGGVNESLRWNK